MKRIPTVTWVALGAAAVSTVLYVTMRKAQAAQAPAVAQPQPLPPPPTRPPPTTPSPSIPPLITPTPQFDPFDKLGPFKTGITEEEKQWLRDFGARLFS